MDHSYIAEHSLIDRYRRGLLPAEVEQDFEEHFFGCPECAQQLELARGLAAGVKAMAGEDVAAAVPTTRPVGAVDAGGAAGAIGAVGALAAGGTVGPAGAAGAVGAAGAAGAVGYLTRRPRHRRGVRVALAAAALLAAAVLPAGWLVWRDGHRDRAAAANAAALARQLDVERRRTATIAGQLAASEAGRAAERLQAAAKLAAAQQDRTGSDSLDRRWTEPLAGMAVVLLQTFRDNPGGAGDGPTTIDGATAASQPLALAVAAADDGRYESYRITLWSGSRILVQQNGLRPNALETLMITFPPGYLKPGEYRLDVAGVPAGGEATVALGSHRVRVAGGGR